MKVTGHCELVKVILAMIVLNSISHTYTGLASLPSGWNNVIVAMIHPWVTEIYKHTMQSLHVKNKKYIHTCEWINSIFYIRNISQNISYNGLLLKFMNSLNYVHCLMNYLSKCITYIYRSFLVPKLRKTVNNVKRRELMSGALREGSTVFIS